MAVVMVARVGTGLGKLGLPVIALTRLWAIVTSAGTLLADRSRMAMAR